VTSDPSQPGLLASPEPIQLAYAPPVAVHAPTVETDATTGTLRFDLGPMPTSMFVQLIVPSAILLGALATMLGAIVIDSRFPRPHDLTSSIILLAFTLGTGVWIWLISRHRGISRVLEVSGRLLLYRGPHTGPIALSVDSQTIEKLKVRRDALRPWLWIMEALLKHPGFLSLQSSKPPVFLTRHNNGQAMREIAERLMTAMELPQPGNKR